MYAGLINDASSGRCYGFQNFLYINISHIVWDGREQLDMSDVSELYTGGLSAYLSRTIVYPEWDFLLFSSIAAKKVIVN